MCTIYPQSEQTPHPKSQERELKTNIRTHRVRQRILCEAMPTARQLPPEQE